MCCDSHLISLWSVTKWHDLNMICDDWGINSEAWFDKCLNVSLMNYTPFQMLINKKGEWLYMFVLNMCWMIICVECLHCAHK